MSKLMIPIGDMFQQFEITADTRVMFVTGSGLSTASGLPTYYGDGGLYEGLKDGPEVIMNQSVLDKHPEKIWDMLMPMMKQSQEVKPNIAHEVIGLIQSMVAENNSMVFTQNVDGLHKVFSKNIIEIHGNCHDVFCRSCFYKGLKAIKPRFQGDKTAYKSFESVEKQYQKGVCPVCPDCGGRLRPDIVPFYGELDMKKLDAMKLFVDGGVDLLVIVGTQANFPYIQYPINRAYAKDALVLNVNPSKLYLDYAYPTETGLCATDFFYLLKKESCI